MEQRRRKKIWVGGAFCTFCSEFVRYTKQEAQQIFDHRQVYTWCVLNARALCGFNSLPQACCCQPWRPEFPLELSLQPGGDAGPCNLTSEAGGYAGPCHVLLHCRNGNLPAVEDPSRQGRRGAGRMEHLMTVMTE